MREYYIFLDRQNVGNAPEDVLEINCPSDSVVEVLEAHFAETASETALQTSFSWIKGYTTSGSGGGTVTPTPVSTGDPAFGGTVERNNSTVAISGTPLIMPSEGFDIRQGFHFCPKPEGTIKLSPSERVVLRQPAAPGSAWSCSGWALIREHGG